jgi:cytochrome c-type biogenesis protein CcmH
MCRADGLVGAVCAAALAALIAWPAFAAAPGAPGTAATASTTASDAAADPALEAQMLAIAAELRCLVCQNQTIADSNAELAVDLRRQVREMLNSGKSKDEIYAYMTDRYGDFVLYRPPLKSSTAVLWFGPALLMVAGVATLVLILRRRQRLAADRFEPDPVDDSAFGDETPPAR